MNERSTSKNLRYHQKKLVGFIYVIFLFLHTADCFSQSYSAMVRSNLYMHVNNKVDSIIGNDFVLMNARIFINKYPKTKGKPYFETTTDTPGKLILGKKEYNNVKLIYDIYDQKICFIVEKSGYNGTILELNNQAVTRFHLDNKNFVNSSELSILPQTGFYEKIFLGKHLKVYARWSKEYMDRISDEYMGEFSDQKRKLFFDLDGQIADISSQNSFLKIFARESKQINSFLKKKKIRFSKSNNNELIKLFEYTDSLL
jgi:hypothetical protein